MASSRGLHFLTGGVYHVLNRGVERRPIFTNSREHERFVMLLDYYRVQRPPLSFSHFLALPKQQRETYHQSLEKRALLINIIAYCLMPNHFHLMLEQKEEGGIVRALSNISNGYAKYFNTKRRRVGPLFQGPFKAVHIETDEQLIHVSRYLHINPVVSGITSPEKLFSYPWSSISAYREDARHPFVNTKPVLARFRSKEAYASFLLDQVSYGEELEKIKHLMLEKEDV